MFDPRTEETICRAYASRIRAYGLLHLRNEDQAVELVQHVLASVIQAVRAGRLKDPTKLPAYVLGTARNTISEWRRSDRRRASALEQYATSLEGIDIEPDDARADLEKLRQCLQGLSARDASVVSLTYLRGRSSEDVGGELGMTPGAIRVARHRALKRLLTCMETAA